VRASTVRLSQALYDLLQERAAANHRSMSAETVMVVEQALDQPAKKNDRPAISSNQPNGE